MWWWLHPVNGCHWGALWKGRSQSRWSLHHLQEYVCGDAWFLLGNSPCSLLRACVSEPVFVILPSSGQDGFGFSFLCLAHLPIFVTLSPLSPFFPSPFSLPCWSLLSLILLSLLSRWYLWQWGWDGFQKVEGCSTGRTTFPFVLNSPAFVWNWEKWLRVILDGAWSDLA